MRKSVLVSGAGSAPACFLSDFEDLEKGVGFSQNGFFNLRSLSDGDV